MSLELAPRGRPRGSASVRRPLRIRSRAFSAPQRFLQARAPRPCFMPQPFLRSTPFRGFPSQESRALLPLESLSRLPEISLGCPRSASVAQDQLREIDAASSLVVLSPTLLARLPLPFVAGFVDARSRALLPSPACRCPPTTMTPFPRSSPPCLAASRLSDRVSSTLPGRRELRSARSEDPIAAQVWPRPLRSLVPPASPCARAEVASDTRSILSWVFTPL